MYKFVEKPLGGRYMLISLLMVGILAVTGLYLFGGTEESDGAVVASGTCGTNLNWEYDDETTTLTISGSGTTMKNFFSSGSNQPWRAYRSAITNVVFDTPNLTNIGIASFYSCSAIITCNLPENITSIGELAFNGCTNLKMSPLSDNITSIGPSAFSGDSELTWDKLPRDLTRIEYNCFAGCTNLALTQLPSNIVEIGERAFLRCTNLALLTLPDNIVIIRPNTFQGCTSITQLVLPDSITSIETYAFAECTNLILSKLPDSLDSINHYAFSRCTNISFSDLPNKLKSIGEWAFVGCTSISEISIPSSIESIGQKAFENCTNLNTVYFNAISMSSTYSRFNSPFYNIILTNITIGENVQNVPTGLFSTNLYKADEVTVKWNAIHCEDIPQYNILFEYRNVTDIEFGEEVEYIPAYLTDSIKIRLTTVNMSDSITVIGANAFTGISDIDNKMVLPESVVGYYTDNTFTTKADLYAGQVGYGAVIQSATADPHYDSKTESVNLDTVTADMVVSGTELPMTPEYMVYPNEYVSGSDGGILGTLVKLIPLFVILGILMSLVGAYFVRSRHTY